MNRVRHLCGTHLVFLLILLASTLTVAAAQTGASPSAGIHDHLRKAEEYLNAKDPDSAAKEFEAVLAVDPKNAQANANLGVIAFSRRDYRNASQYLRRALATDPSLTKTEALLGICQKRLGDPSARALLEKSFPKLKDKPLRMQTGLELAGLYDQLGDPGATAAVMRSLVDLDPDNVDVLFMAQRVYAELADDTLNKLAVLAPGSARMQQVIAERLVNGGDLDNAIDHYRRALQLDPRLPGVHFELGEAILESARGDAGKEAEAQKELEAAVAVDGDTAKTECEFGSLALSQSQMDQAFTHYQRAYELDPNEVQAQMGLAKLLMKQGKTQEAVKYLRLAIQSDPLNGSAHYQLGRAYKLLQMTDAAQQEMRLFQEIKKTKDQVADLYHQMNRQTKPEADEVPGSTAGPQ
ncbi:MAG TPA: tetratricopeptide repeat protein [Candidatus Sulfotelmatobacter sp.]|nr:tetratricopeptide repeat protein [Candidatus Sulfotelmatobacter sp.]